MPRFFCLIAVITMFLGLVLICQKASTAEATAMKVDEFVGEYYQCGSYTAELAKAKKVTIVKDKDVCRIKGVKVWDSCRFVVHGDNRLRDSKKHIGDLVLGEMKFPDERGARKVLRADFCYDYFVLVSTRPTN